MSRKNKPKLKHPPASFPRAKVVLREPDPTPQLLMPDGTPARKSRPRGHGISLLKPQEELPVPIRGPWVFRIPAYYPPSQNTWQGGHYSKVHKLKRQTADLIGTYARLCSVPLVTYDYRPVRLCRMTVIGWADGSTMPDGDNLLKVFRDALVWARVIVDDGKDFARFTEPVTQRGSPAETIIEIADLADTPPVRPEQDPHTRRMLAALKRKGRRESKG